ncbi:hypothetical protein SPSIL_008790 [Sporomusa silvacetica DSM 10669]|uniref:Uncharacterized protein n=1 Tax=Sporomusa silvacetica DSM 10669 TaxID=1123289 RepID=A0ABZ3IGL9_9FIRM|nr:hypothetical protein [Sporomusa silvacetica]OZC13161.1 hypothetical protein SPSIL_56170 [Sporomusa silvacetica DSM 10669]
MVDDAIHSVNVGRVAKNVLSIGRFGLFQVEDSNLIATDWFILSVTDDQFWKIQCKLEARQKNVWLYKSKDSIQECTGATAAQTYELYCNLVYEKTEQLKRTSLNLGGIELFTDDGKYIGIQAKHLDMIEYAPVVKKARNRESAIVDDVHVFTIVSKESTESKYLRPLTNHGEGA